MNKSEVLESFNKYILPHVITKYGNDKIAIRAAWNDYVDHMQKSEEITELQANNWSNPFDK